MTKLKTFKDIEEETELMHEEGQWEIDYEDVENVFIDIKKEAIKWVKQMEETTPIIKGRMPPSIFRQHEILVEWVKMFFNITKDELVNKK